MVQTSTIAFPVNLGGKELLATILEEEFNPVQYVYRILFSDGHEDSFTVSEFGKIEGTKINSTLYSKAIKNDLFPIIGLDKSKFFYVFPEVINGIKTNVWIVENDTEEGEQIFKVYYQGDYHFELKKGNGKWLSRCARVVNPEKVDPTLAAKISNLIDSQL
jgi:hypothetical protein